MVVTTVGKIDDLLVESVMESGVDCDGEVEEDGDEVRTEKSDE